MFKKKSNNEIQNIFLHDIGSNLKNLSPNVSSVSSTTIVANKGLVNEIKMILFNGQIISSKDNNENEIIKFEQLNIDLGDLATSTIKKPKLQEISTIKLLKCFFLKNIDERICREEAKKEIITYLD